MKSNAFIIMSFCLLAAISLAGEEINLNQYTAECIRAAKIYRPIQKDFFYKVLHTVDYAGWIGEPDKLELKHPIAMTIRYAGSHKEGQYWRQHAPQKKLSFNVRSDLQGKIQFIPKDKELLNYEFRGIIKQGPIMGLWENAERNKSFAFYAYPIKQMDKE